MSRLRRSLVPAGTAIALLGCSSAAAAPRSFTYQCTYPLIGEQPVVVDIDAPIANHLAVGERNPAFTLQADARAGGVAQQGLAMVGAASVEGTGIARAAVRQPSGSTAKLGVPLSLAAAQLPAKASTDGLRMRATSPMPTLGFTKDGTADITLAALQLKLVARDSSGRPLTSLARYQQVPASDNDPTTFDVPCRQDSRTPDWRLASIGIGSGVGDQLPSGAMPMPAPASTTVSFSYALSGTSEMRTVTTGTLPVAGSVSTTMDLATGAWHGAMTLADATAELRSAGLKVVVTNAYEVVGEASGTLINGKLVSRSKATIHVRKVMLGALDLLKHAGDCHSETPTEFVLSSTAPFSPLEGGTITGTFAISKLVDCGPLGTIVSNNTKGAGNVVTMNLKPIS